MSESNDSTVYQARLVEIFQACDSDSKGYLSLLEFERLCRDLQLQPHKHRLYRELGLSRTSGGAKVRFEDFKSVLLSLLHEVGPDTRTADQPPYGLPTDTDGKAADFADRKVDWKPQEQNRNPPSGNADLHLHLPPDMTEDDEEGFDASGDQGDGKGRMSPPSPLKRAYVEDGGDDGQGNKHLRTSSPLEVETFEADGLLTSSPIEGDRGLDSDSGLEQLRHVCSSLGVGCHGYLSQSELGQVCQFIGMEQMDSEELQILFTKLDADCDGYISFGEFVEGLARHAITPRGFDAPLRSPALRPHSARKARTPFPPAHHEQRSPAVCASGDSINLFSSLQLSENSGLVTGEEVVDFWEQLNVPHGADILMSLGFDLQSKLSLKELSAALNAEWSNQMQEGGTLAHAITSTYMQELLCLRSWLDQTKEERKKLRSDLADAHSRISQMAAEVDERHTLLEKSHEEHLKATEQDHQDQLRQMQYKLEQEQETQSSQSALLRQTSEQLQDLHQQVSQLQDRLEQADSEVSKSQRELSVAQEKESEWEARYAQLQKEVQQQQNQGEPDSPHSTSWEREKQAAEEKVELYAAQNKELKDHNDELLIQLEELQQQLASGQQQQQNAAAVPPRSNSLSRIPVRTRASSISSDASEWEEDDLLSSTEALFYRQHSLPAATDDSETKAPSLSAELKQQQRQRRGERLERERKEIEHGFRVEIAELEDRYNEERQQLVQNLEKEKGRLREEYQSQLSQQLAEQQRELQNAFAMEKQDLLQQYESRRNLDHLQHQQELQALQDRLDNTAPKADPIQDIAVQLHARSKLQELEQAKAEVEQDREKLQAHYEMELHKLQVQHEEDVAQLKAEEEGRVQASLSKVFREGAEGLEGQLKEDFLLLVQQQLHKEPSAVELSAEKEELGADLEQDKVTVIQHYESQIMTLQKELGALRKDFEVERLAFQQLQSGDLAQSIRQELQEEMGGQVDELRQSWEEERRELVVQNQLLEEELADVKGLLMQERQRSSETHTLRDTVRRLRGENKEVQSLAESLKEKMSRIHQQQDLERANYERRIDELEKAKEQALRVQALQHAGTVHPQPEEENTLQKDVLQKVMEEVESVRSDSPTSPAPQQENLDELQVQINQLHYQLHEARTAQFEYQRLKDECELLRQTNSNLEEMVRVLRQRSSKEQAEREREEQDQMHELWEEKKKLQNLLQRTTDKLLKTSAEMAAGQTQLVREVEQLKLKAGNMVELETFTGLQVSLLETQRHAISLQEALMQRTQLADRIMSEAEKERRQERESWEEQKTEMQSRFNTTMEMYRSLAAQHKSLRQSTTKLATQLKELYVENADLMKVLQQTEAKHIATQRKNRKLQLQCQAWHDSVYRMLHNKQDSQGPVR